MTYCFRCKRKLVKEEPYTFISSNTKWKPYCHKCYNDYYNSPRWTT